MGSWDIRPELLHAALADVAADGQSMALAADAAARAGDETAGAFGTASDVAAAFGRFWAPRKDVGRMAASLVFHKAGAAAGLVELFGAADAEMSDAASSAGASVASGVLTGRGFGAAVR